jgi:hypothetical protein
MNQTNIVEHSVVVIPGPESTGVNAWSDGTNSWLESLLPKVTEHVHLFAFEYEFNLAEDYPWSRLLGTGPRLLDLLIDRKFQSEVCIMCISGI